MQGLCDTFTENFDFQNLYLRLSTLPADIKRKKKSVLEDSAKLNIWLPT